MSSSSLFKRINERLALKGRSYTSEEIDAHEDAKNIWATVALCKQDADAIVKQAYQDGYWDGVSDRGSKYTE